MFGFLKKQELMEQDTVEWLFDVFAWSLRNFGRDVFFNETILVVPSNKHFPGRVNSVEGMASLIFEQVQTYAGLKHWPCRLQDMNTIDSSPASTKLLINGALRGKDGVAVDAVDEEHKLLVAYNPHQISDPEAMIASYAHTLAHYLGSMAQESPPGGEDLWPHVTEIVAVFMGFGLMFANTASVYRGGGCASCYNPRAERMAFLSQDEVTYALALFCVLKGIPDKEVLANLKKHLRPVFKKAIKDIRLNTSGLHKLRAIESVSLLPE